MTIERMIELLKIEHECMLRYAHDDCDRKCADCEFVQEDGELHEMYTNVVCLLKEQEAVVRCKDCRWAEVSDNEHTWCDHVDHEFCHKNDWFCADGERKEVK